MLGLDPSISGRRGAGQGLLVRRFSGLRSAPPENDDLDHAALAARPSAAHFAYQLLKRRHSVST
jgi:hypothetical protein